MKVIGIMDLCMAKEYFNGWMDQDIKDNLYMEENKDLELLPFLMGIIIKVIGLEVNNKELEHYMIKIISKLKKVLGLMVYFLYLYKNNNGKIRVK